MIKDHPKRILVACNHLEHIGGSELYTFYLIKALAALPGHSIEYFTFFRGLVSNKIEGELGVGFKSGSAYDLIIASHHTTVGCLFGQGPIIQICHGTIHELEQPSRMASAHVAVSEEVALHLRKSGFDAKVMLNGVDLEVFKSTKPLNKTLSKVLSLCQSEEANTLLAEICSDNGWHFQAFNKHRNPKFEISDEINDADLVVGIGRSVYDAMACGRPCVVFDARAYNGQMGDGYLHPDKFSQFAQNNCSGRFTKKVFTKEELQQEIKQYNADHGLLLRHIAEAQLNQQKTARQFLEMAEELGGLCYYWHQLKIKLFYSKYLKTFKSQKQQYRAKMKKQYDAGVSMEEIKRGIKYQELPKPVRASLYFYYMKLKRKRRRGAKKDLS